MPTTSVTKVTRLRLAAIGECDLRTVDRALREGVHTIRTAFVRERLERALRDLGIDTGPPRPATPSAAGAQRSADPAEATR